MACEDALPGDRDIQLACSGQLQRVGQVDRLDRPARDQRGVDRQARRRGGVAPESPGLAAESGALAASGSGAAVGRVAAPVPSCEPRSTSCRRHGSRDRRVLQTNRLGGGIDGPGLRRHRLGRRRLPLAPGDRPPRPPASRSNDKAQRLIAMRIPEIRRITWTLLAPKSIARAQVPPWLYRHSYRSLWCLHLSTAQVAESPVRTRCGRKRTSSAAAPRVRLLIIHFVIPAVGLNRHSNKLFLTLPNRFQLASICEDCVKSDSG